jgi:hypothetical protein
MMHELGSGIVGLNRTARLSDMHNTIEIVEQYAIENRSTKPNGQAIILEPALNRAKQTERGEINN